MFILSCDLETLISENLNEPVSRKLRIAQAQVNHLQKYKPDTNTGIFEICLSSHFTDTVSGNHPHES